MLFAAVAGICFVILLILLLLYVSPMFSMHPEEDIKRYIRQVDDIAGMLADQIYQCWLELLTKVNADEKQVMFSGLRLASPVPLLII